ncbi:MAG: hypothetical protein HZA61_07230 [Candidatus Eisenbacteria bacterium]|uniref:Uncharacterized protein n=1 Tax=Eiseniibacteriota bacterium TaxID=2212470 RepID=A0A933SBH0_UNCEI|nr:hypothetical protein [Candidatus Eisenbacteria bacterium]
MRRKTMAVPALVLSMVLITLSGCSRVVVDNKGLLKDGGKWEFPLKAGTYQVEMTAGGDGASVQWQGCDCPGTGPVRKWRSRCRIDGEGKLIVRNPSLLHLGSDTQVTLKVTKVPR